MERVPRLLGTLVCAVSLMVLCMGFALASAAPALAAEVELQGYSNDTEIKKCDGNEECVAGHALVSSGRWLDFKAKAIEKATQEDITYAEAAKSLLPEYLVMTDPDSGDDRLIQCRLHGHTFRVLQYCSRSWETKPHKHNWTFSSDENVIRATCDNDYYCPVDGEATLTLEPATMCRTGKPIAVSFSEKEEAAWTKAGFAIPEISYINADSGQVAEGSVTENGRYKTSATAQGMTITSTLVVEDHSMTSWRWWEPGYENHYRYCERCESEESIEEEAHYGGTATCMELAECEACGSQYGECGDHDISWSADATTHWGACQVEDCDVTLEPALHNWSNGKCSVCEYDCTHDGTTSGVCAVCGLDLGSPDETPVKPDGGQGSATTDTTTNTTTNTSTAVKAPAKLAASKIKLTVGKHKLVIDWPNVKNAKKYQIKYRISGKKTWKTKWVTKSKLTLKKLKPGKRYQIKIRSKNAAGYSKWSKIKKSKRIK